MSRSVYLEVDDKNVGWIYFDNKDAKVNTLSQSVMEAFGAVLDEVTANKEIKMVVVASKKEGCFIAGAEIREIETVTDRETARAMLLKSHEILGKLESLPMPTLAYIDGSCLGGGLELALCCDYRICTDGPKTKIGLPEVNLGIIPGFGGTQRLPRLIGFQNSLGLILAGKQVDARKAEKLGIVNAFIPVGYEQFRLPEYIDKMLAGKVKTQAKIAWYERIELVRNYMAGVAKKALLEKTRGNYPAPLAALDVINDTFGLTLEAGLKRECDVFCELVVTDISKNLIQLFFMSEALKKESGIESGAAALAVDHTAVIGSGVMGGGIAWLFSNADRFVRIKVRHWDSLGSGFKQITKVYDGMLKRRKLTFSKAELKLNKISYTTDYSGFENIDLAVEAIVEDMEAKQTLFGELEAVMGEKAIIASNTSSLSITEMAAKMKHPERCVGMHFFNPVNRMPLVEVIAGEKSSDEAVATVVQFAKACGKTPVVVGDCAGFVVNRILLPFINEAVKMAQEGYDFEQIDNLLIDFGTPMGAFILADEVGLDVGYKVAKELKTAYGDRMEVATLMSQMVEEEKLLGKKGGAGFYIHTGKSRKPNDKIAKMVGKELIHADEQLVLDRTVLMMVNEAARILEEKMIKDASHLDMAMIMGAGFPPFRGGLLKYADSYGIDRVVSRLKSLSAEYGSRFEPASLLTAMAEKGKRFYEQQREEQ